MRRPWQIGNAASIGFDCLPRRPIVLWQRCSGECWELAGPRCAGLFPRSDRRIRGRTPPNVETPRFVARRMPAKIEICPSRPRTPCPPQRRWRPTHRSLRPRFPSRSYCRRTSRTRRTKPLSSDRPILAFLKRAAQRIDDWFCGDGRWYLGSAAVHAIAILCLGLIVSSPPQEVRQDEAASFDAAEADAATPKIDRYELGDAPLDPSELDTDTLALTKALPVAREARHYDDFGGF